MSEIKFQIEKDLIINLNCDNIFKPNLTSQLVYRSCKEPINNITNEIVNILEIGCGSGVIGIALIKKFINNKKLNLWFSDYSVNSVELAKDNFSRNGVQFKSASIGSLLDPWLDQGLDFDIIINDVSAISEDLAINSPWFGDFVPCQSGRSGVDLTIKFLNQLLDYKIKYKFAIFPVLSLSNTNLVTEFLNKHNFNYTIAQSKAWPLPNTFSENNKILLDRLKNDKIIDYKIINDIYIAETSIFLINNEKTN